MASGKISKNARRSGLMSKGGASVVIENDSTRGKVFVEVRDILKQNGITFQNLSSSHPISVSKGTFEQASELIKTALDGRYSVEKEEAGTLVLIENDPKTPVKMMVKESPFTWFQAD